MIWLPLRVALVVAFLAPATPASAQSGTAIGKLDSVLKQSIADGTKSQRRRVIVRAAPGAAADVQALLQIRGATVRKYHFSSNAFEADASDVDQFAGDPRIAGVSVDADVHAHGTTADSQSRVLTRTLGLTGTYTGAGVGVAVIDSGLEPSEDFSKRITAFYDFTRGGVASKPYDDYGHGTHVAGLIGGSGALSVDQMYAGISPGVRFVVLKVLDSHGGGHTSDVISAIEFATANRVALGINIINLSLGHPVFESAATDPLVYAVEAAVRSGIVVVASAGNYGRNPQTGLVGYAGIVSPGNAPSALTAGATQTQDTVRRADDRIPGYSSRGPTYYDGLAKPDFVVPGHQLVSDAAKQGTLYQSYPALIVAGKSGLDYIKLSGTSMSAAVTSGVVAQVIEASRQSKTQPALTPNAIKAVLQFTASVMRDDKGKQYDYLTQGAGELNGAGAIELTSAIVTTTPVGQNWLRFGVGPLSTIEKEKVIWANTVIWGNTLIWGDTIALNRGAWATTVIWGNAINDDTVIWGNNVVWDDTVIWGNTIVWGDTVIWGNALDDDTVIWGNILDDDTVIWGNGLGDDTVIWGNTLVNPQP